MSYRMQANRMTHLILHEMLEGSTYVFTFEGPHKEPTIRTIRIRIKKVYKTTNFHTQAHILSGERQSSRAEGKTTKGGGARWPVVPEGFRRKWNEPRREGPFKVTNATLTAIEVEGSSTWYHLNHLQKRCSTKDEGGAREGTGCRCSRHWTTTPGPDLTRPGTTDIWGVG